MLCKHFHPVVAFFFSYYKIISSSIFGLNEGARTVNTTKNEKTLYAWIDYMRLCMNDTCILIAIIALDSQMVFGFFMRGLAAEWEWFGWNHKSCHKSDLPKSLYQILILASTKSHDEAPHKQSLSNMKNDLILKTWMEKYKNLNHVSSHFNLKWFDEGRKRIEINIWYQIDYKWFVIFQRKENFASQFKMKKHHNNCMLFKFLVIEGIIWKFNRF